jgi:peptidoglycan/LPS O-acetylase OafA/YrhL
VKGRIGHVAGLDGLRGLAVAAVLLYHGGLVAGGFLGVEVFFVISGYLITLILLDEWQHGARIDVTAFWIRRARRLWPASFTVILGTLAFATLFLPHELFSLRGAALAGLLSVSNWYSILAHQSYFEAVGRPPLLRHLWSLAIEAQFYAFWPLLLVLGLRFWRGRLQPLALGVIALGLASAGAMAWLYQPDADPSRVYYGTDTRASGLLLGAALALAFPAWWRRVRPAVVDAVGIAAVFGLGCVCILMNEFEPLLYRGGFVLVDVLTATTIAAAVHGRGRIGRRVLDTQPLRWIGARSYGIYLWHWPVFMVTRPQLDVRLDGWPLLILRLILVGALAELSYRFVEMPFRRGRVHWVQATGGLAVGMLVLGTSVVAAKEPERPAYLPVDAINTWTAASAPVGEPAQAWSQQATALAQEPPAAPVNDQVVDPATEPAVATENTAPTAGAPPARQRPLRVTAIGDSVMLGAATALESEIDGIAIDAAISRQASEAIELLRERAASGELGDVVIVHMGNNGTFTATQFDTMMDVLASVPRVVFINDKVPRPWEGPNDAVIAEGVQRYPNTMLVDWRGASSQRSDYFWEDGMHLRAEGAAAYAALIASQIAL